MSTTFIARSTKNGGFTKAEDLSASAGLGISGFHSAILEQNLNPTLTLRATTTEGAGNVKLTVNGGSDQTFNSGANVDTAFKGLYGRLGKSLKDKNNGTFFSMTYVMTALSGAFSAKSGTGGAVSFTNGKGETVSTENTFGAPVFSNTTQSSSDWTNSVFNENDGCKLTINNIKQTVSTVSSSNDTLTLTFNVYVDSWGRKDVTMALAFNNLITRS